MASTLIPGANRTDLWKVDPNDLVVREELRGRFMKISEEAVIRMADSMFDNKQKQPVLIRKDGDKAVLVAGFTRTAAARLIRDGYIGLDGVERKDSDFKLSCMLTNCNDQDALIGNIVENAHRNMTSPIDDAHNQEKLRDRYGYQDTQIAKLYGYDLSKVLKLKKLLQLDEATQKMIHDGNFAARAALDLLDAPADERKKILESAIQENGTVSSTIVRKQVREHHLADQPEDEADKPDIETASDKGGKKAKGKRKPKGDGKGGKFKSRSLKEIKVYFSELKKSNEGNDKVAKLATGIIHFIEGRRSDMGMAKLIAELLPAA